LDLGDDLSLFILKIIGLITMFVDHYQVMIGGSEILRVIGRLSFPIFAFTLNEGYVHTRNLKKYLLRLFCFAVVIQGLFILCADGRDINIFFTLFLGLFTICILNLKKSWIKEPFMKIIKAILIIFILYFSQKINLDYGAYGILLIMIFNIFRNNNLKILISFLTLNIFNLVFPNVFQIVHTQIFSLISLIFIFLYNGEKGRNIKFFFYLFYPIHFFILGIIKFF